MKKTFFVLCCAVLVTCSSALAEKITIAAAADMKFAMEDIAKAFRAAHPADEVQVVFGSSGKAHTQIQQGAPYDLFFSADEAFPRELIERGVSASPQPIPYARGRIVLWGTSHDASAMTLASLDDPAIIHVATADPSHAPYGQRAVEALKASGLWNKVESKMVYGENITQAAQFVQSGNAELGIIALSVALAPELAGKSSFFLIPDSLHNPLEQAFIITKRAEKNVLAHQFAAYMQSSEARAVMVRYGFVLPGEIVGQ